MARCIEHTIHLMACHFVTALNIPGIRRTKQKLCQQANGLDKGEEGELNEVNKPFDVDTSMEVEASSDDVEAICAALNTNFNADNIVGKLLAFIAQLRSCGEDTCNYLTQLAAKQGCPEWEIKLWIWTHWGSLSDCFCTALTLQKVCHVYCIYIFLAVVNIN